MGHYSIYSRMQRNILHCMRKENIASGPLSFTLFRNGNFKHKMKRLQILKKLVYEKCYVHEKILRTRNCHREFFKNLLPEKRKENT